MSEAQKHSAAGRLTRNFWVGFFSIMGFLLLTALTISLRHWDFLSNRVEYYVLFRNVSRLDSGAQVLMAGVAIGEVTGLEFVHIEDYRVRVKIKVDRKVKLYPDSHATVIAAAVIGDTTVNLEQGKTGNPLDPGSEIKGEAAPQIEDIARNVSESINSVTSLLSDPRTRDAMQRTLINLASATEKMDATFGMINTEMHPMIEDLHKTATSMNAFLEDARKLTTQATGDLKATRGDLQKTADAWTNAAKSLSGQTQRLADSMQRVSDQLNGAISENRAPVRQSVEQLNEAAKSFKAIADKLNNGDGTAGKLLTDERLFENLNRLIVQITRTLGGGREPAFPIEGNSPRGANSGRRNGPLRGNAGSIAPMTDEPGTTPPASGSGSSN